MRKILFGIVSTAGSIGAVKWGIGTIFWVGFGILCFIGLVLFILITWGLVKLFKWSITIALYDILTIATISTLTARGLVSLNWYFATTLPLTVCFSLIIIRFIAYHAQTSVIWSEIFSWITGYKIHYIYQDKKQERKIAPINNAKTEITDKANIISALTNWGYSKQEAKRGAEYALEESPEALLEEKVICALNYIKSDKVLENMD